jgi:hypothetical protein
MIRVVNPGSRIQMLTFSHPGSRIQGSKRYPIPDPGSGSATLLAEIDSFLRDTRYCTVYRITHSSYQILYSVQDYSQLLPDTVQCTGLLTALMFTDKKNRSYTFVRVEHAHRICNYYCESGSGRIRIFLLNRSDKDPVPFVNPYLNPSYLHKT